MLMFVFCTGFLNFMEYMIIIVYFDFKLQVDTASCRLVAASRGGSNIQKTVVSSLSKTELLAHLGIPRRTPS